MREKFFRDLRELYIPDEPEQREPTPLEFEEMDLENKLWAVYGEAKVARNIDGTEQPTPRQIERFIARQRRTNPHP